MGPPDRQCRPGDRDSRYSPTAGLKRETLDVK